MVTSSHRNVVYLLISILIKVIKNRLQCFTRNMYRCKRSELIRSSSQTILNVIVTVFLHYLEVSYSSVFPGFAKEYFSVIILRSQKDTGPRSKSAVNLSFNPLRHAMCFRVVMK